MSEERRTIENLQTIIYSLLGVLLVGIVGVVIYRRSTASKLKTSQLNTKIRELELTAIRAQMNPHFLYNALNSIQNLVQKSMIEEAHLYISRFATLIRSVLKYTAKDEITLAEELDMIREYVALEQLRFAFEFEIEMDKSIEPHLVFVPPLLLQPIVENAIVHGLANKKEDKKLQIKIYTQTNRLCIEVIDNGIGLEASKKLSKATTGKGLQFSSDRMELLKEQFGDQYTFEVKERTQSDGSTAGTVVKLCFSDE